VFEGVIPTLGARYREKTATDREEFERYQKRPVAPAVDNRLATEALAVKVPSRRKPRRWLHWRASRANVDPRGFPIGGTNVPINFLTVQERIARANPQGNPRAARIFEATGRAGISDPCRSSGTLTRRGKANVSVLLADRVRAHGVL